MRANSSADADACIAHAQRAYAVRLLDAQGHAAIVFGVFRGIDQKVEDDLLDPGCVGARLDGSDFAIHGLRLVGGQD